MTAFFRWVISHDRNSDEGRVRSWKARKPDTGSGLVGRSP